MNLAILLHLYQPSFQKESVFKQIATECYLPLVRLLKSKSNYKITLNTPLSLLELMESFGYFDWIKDVSELVQRGQVELVGSGAYHPLLPKLPVELVEEQVLLNEYGLGYYFGKKKDFEGEEGILLQNVRGFFPPELAVNERVLDILAELGYEWCVVNPEEGHTGSTVSSYKETNLNIITRNRNLSDKFAFKRDSSIEDIQESLSAGGIIAVDGETFGHHNKEGIILLDKMYSYLTKNNISLSFCSELAKNSYKQKVTVFDDSSWGLKKDNNVYALWDTPTNSVQQMQWQAFNHLIAIKKDDTNIDEEILAKNARLWGLNPEKIAKKSDKGVKEVLRRVLLLKSMNSDQFWWASKFEVGDKGLLYNKDMILRSLAAYGNYMLTFAPDEVDKELVSLVARIEKETISTQ